MRPLLLIALVCLLSVLLLPAALPTSRAQAATTTLYQNFDDLDDISYTLVRGTVGGGETGNGVRSNGGSGTSPVNEAAMNAPLHIILDVPSWCVLQSITWRESGTRSQQQAFNQLFLHRELLDSAGESHWFTINAGFDFAWRTASIVPAEFPWSEGGAYGPGGQVQLYYGGSNTGDTLIFDSFVMVCEGAQPLIRPFGVADEWVEVPDTPLFDPPPMYDYRSSPTQLVLGTVPFTNALTVVARSKTAGAPVMAAADGIITSIQAFDPYLCDQHSVTFRSLTGQNYCGHTLPNEMAENPLQYYGGLTEPLNDIGAVVTLETTEGDVLQYLVKNASNYIHVGLEVQGGCILGESIAVSSFNQEFGAAIADLIRSIFGGLAGTGADVVLDARPSGEGVIFMQWVDSTENLYDRLLIYNDPTSACNVDPALALCLTDNPQLTENGQGWTSFGTVNWNTRNNEGADVWANSVISQTLALNSATLHTATFEVTGDFGPSSNAVVQLGNLTEQVTVNPGINTLILQGTPTPDYGTLYTLSLTNIGPTPFYVSSICLVEGNTTPVTTCFLVNPTFDLGWEGWTISEPSMTARDGVAWVPIDQDIRQTISLPGGATYRVSIDARVWIDEGMSGQGGGVSLNVSWPTGGSASLAFDPTYNDPGRPGFPNLYQTFTTDVAVSTTANGEFILEPVFTAPDVDIFGLFISRVCISTVGPDGGNVFTPECEILGRPVNNDVGPWTSWHWHMLNRFFTCDLMVFLNDQYSFFQDTARTSFMATRWFMSSINYTATWAQTDLFPWLNGHFRNIAVGQVTTVNQSGGAGVWDVLLALISQVLNPLTQSIQQIVDVVLWAFTGVAAILFQVVNLIIVMGVQFLTIVLSVFAMARDVLVAVINAFNSAPVDAITILPQCGIDPRDHVFCVALWILDNTILSGPGEFIIPLLVSIGSIHLLVWVVESYRRLLIRIGSLA